MQGAQGDLPLILRVFYPPGRPGVGYVAAGQTAGSRSMWSQ